MYSQPSEPIAVVGSGCRFPGGATSPSSLWRLLENPRDVSEGIKDDRFQLKGYYHPNGAHHGTTNVQRAYMLEENVRLFDATFFNISPNEADSIGMAPVLRVSTRYKMIMYPNIQSRLPLLDSTGVGVQRRGC